MNSTAALPNDYREQTLSMINGMEEPEAKTVYLFVSDIVKKDPSNPFRTLTTDEVKKDLEISTQQFQEGKSTDADVVHSRIRNKYGL